MSNQLDFLWLLPPPASLRVSGAVTAYWARTHLSPRVFRRAEFPLQSGINRIIHNLLHDDSDHVIQGVRSGKDDTDRPQATAVSEDGTSMFRNVQDQIVEWDLLGSQNVGHFTNPANIRALCCYGNFVISADSRNGIKVTDLRSYECMFEFRAKEIDCDPFETRLGDPDHATTSALEVGTEDDLIISRYDSISIAVYSLWSGIHQGNLVVGSLMPLTHRTNRRKRGIKNISLNCDKSLIAVLIGYTVYVKKWPNVDEQVYQLEQRASAMCFHPFRWSALCFAFHGPVHMIDFETREQICIDQARVTSPIAKNVAFTPDASRVIITDHYGSTRIFFVCSHFRINSESESKIIRRFYRISDDLIELIIRHWLRLTFGDVCSRSQRIVLLRMEITPMIQDYCDWINHSRDRTIENQSVFKKAMCLSEDESHLYVALKPESMADVNTETGDIETWEIGHRTEFVDCKSGMIVAGPKYFLITLWDAVTHTHLRTLRGHTDYVSEAKFSDDGKMIVSLDGISEIRLWSSESGSCLRVFNGQKQNISAMALMNDRVLLSYSKKSGITGVWDVDSAKCVWNGQVTLKEHSSVMIINEGSQSQVIDLRPLWIAHHRSMGRDIHPTDSRIIAGIDHYRGIRIANGHLKKISRVFQSRMMRGAELNGMVLFWKGGTRLLSMSDNAACVYDWDLSYSHPVVFHEPLITLPP